MPLTIQDRKAELVRREVTTTRIAADLGLSGAHVSRVLNELSLDGEHAQRIMAHVAGLLLLPIEVVFPVEPTVVYRRKERVG
jgi:hypothetical protein